MRAARTGLTGAVLPLALFFAVAPAVSSAMALETGHAMLSKINIPGPSQPSACHRVDEVGTGLFPRQQIIGYDYKGGEAAKLSRAMDALSEVSESPDPDFIRVILVLGTYEAIAFEFGSDGCHTTTVDFEIEQMVKAFEHAGLAPPFTTTFSRMSDRAVWGLNP